ncbi:MAG: CoA transferase, partial [Pseudohongiellaceae bacterium]
VPYMTGPAGSEEPINSPFPAWDVIAGQQIAIGLLAADRHRLKTGEGQFIKLALQDVALATMGHLGYLAEAELSGSSRPKLGNHIFGTFGHDFPCRDGRRIMIVGVSPNQWQAIVKITGIEQGLTTLAEANALDLDKEGDRFQAREALRELIAPWFAQRLYSEAAEALEAAGACWGPYQTVSELVSEDEDCSEANPLFQRIDQPGIGSYLVPSQPITFTGMVQESNRPAPRLGEHSDEILSELLGLSSAEIGNLHDQGVIAGPADEDS